MNSEHFVNLIKIGQIKKESFNQGEFNGLVFSAKTRLQDAMLPKLSPESQFDLAYNSAHALALAALRKCGYRANNRYIVFQLLPETIGLSQDLWRILAKCHEKRNLAEYEGHIEI
jgi:hypothetical protein